MELLQLVFEYEKSTKGAHRYREVDDDGKEIQIVDSVIGVLYVRKSALGETPIKRLHVEIYDGEPGGRNHHG